MAGSLSIVAHNGSSTLGGGETGTALLQRSRHRARPDGVDPRHGSGEDPRRESYRLGLAQLRPESADEWSRIYPFSMRKYAGNFNGNRCLFRTHEPYMSNPVVKLAAAVPQRWKIDRRLFRGAMRPLLARSWHVPHSRNRLPFFGRLVNLAARPLLGAVRAMRAALTGSIAANQESWPVWHDLARSPEMLEKLRRYRFAECLAATAVSVGGADLGKASGDWPPLQRLMLLQLAYLTAREGTRESRPT